LTQYSGLNPWMNPITDKWLARVRQIADLRGVERLEKIEDSDKGWQAVYGLVSRAHDDTLSSSACRMPPS
jgi:hypothetical protein